MFDPTKPVQTRDGRKARILAADLNVRHGYPIVVALTNADGFESVMSYTADGWTYLDDVERPLDLINVRERTVCFLNLGDSYSLIEPARNAAETCWPIVKIVREGSTIVSAEIVK